MKRLGLAQDFKWVGKVVASHLPYKPKIFGAFTNFLDMAEPRVYYTFMDVTVDEQKRGLQVSIKITAETKLQCEAAIKQYMSEYLPQGYGTEITLEPTQVKEDEWTAQLWRLASCE